MSDAAEVSHIAQLPDEILGMIFQYVELSDFTNLANVCAKWRRFASDRRFWQDATLRFYRGRDYVTRQAVVR